MKSAFVRGGAKTYAVELMEVCRSGYYDWKIRPESERSQDQRKLLG